MAESQRLREAIFHSIEQTGNDLRVQQDATNFDFRKRHYEMKRAKEELEYQMKTVGSDLTDRKIRLALYFRPNKKFLTKRRTSELWRLQLMPKQILLN